MTFDLNKSDWWDYNALLLFLTALIVISDAIVRNSVTNGVVAAGFNGLLGLGMLVRSKIAFWTALILTFVAFLDLLVSGFTEVSNLYSFSFIFQIVGLVFIVMLWRQIRNEMKTVKVKR